MTTINNDSSSSSSPSTNLAWLLECSQLIRDLAESPLEEDKGEHEGNSSLQERVARNFPKAPVCAEKDPHWRLVAEVIHHWGVDPVPFWFYDRFMLAEKELEADKFQTMLAEVRDQVTATEAIADRHRFWCSMLALMQGTEPGSTRFWRCLNAYACGREPRLLQYWTDRMCTVNEDAFHYLDADSFQNSVVEPRCMVALRAVLQEYQRVKKEVAHPFLESLLSTDWMEAFNEAKHCFQNNRILFGSINASHPVAVKWLMSTIPAMYVPTLPLANWLATSIGLMAGRGLLPDFQLSDIPPSLDAFQIMLCACMTCAKGAEAAIAPRLREALDAFPADKADKNASTLKFQCWSLLTGQYAENQIAVVYGQQVEVLEQLKANGLLRLPVVDSDFGARMFAQFIWDGGYLPATIMSALSASRVNFPDRIIVRLHNANATYHHDDYEDHLTSAWRTSNDWKPSCGLRLRSVVYQLHGFGWGTDKTEMRAMVDRLVCTELGGKGGVPAANGGRYILRISADEFMELLDEDSGDAQRLKRLRCV